MKSPSVVSSKNCDFCVRTGVEARARGHEYGGFTMPDNEMPLGTILIAGNDGETCEFWGHWLRSQGYRVLAAEGSGEGLKSLRVHPIDLVLLDPLLPPAGGFPLCRELKSRQETSQLPVVLVTSAGRSEDRIRGIESGVDDFLSKPVRKEELL